MSLIWLVTLWMQSRCKTRYMRTLLIAIFSIMLLACTQPSVHGLSTHEQALAENIGFDPLILKKVKASGFKIEALTGVSRTGNSFIANGLSFKTPEQKSHAVVKQLDAEMTSLGYRIYIQELGYGYLPDRVAIIKSQDPFDILRTRKTHAYTADLDTEQIIARLREWDKRFGLKLMGAGYNWVKTEFERVPEDVTSFSREVLQFCPDVLLFSSGTLAQLSRDITSERSLFLQWK